MILVVSWTDVTPIPCAVPDRLTHVRGELDHHGTRAVSFLGVSQAREAKVQQLTAWLVRGEVRENRQCQSATKTKAFGCREVHQLLIVGKEVHPFVLLGKMRQHPCRVVSNARVARCCHPGDQCLDAIFIVVKPAGQSHYLRFREPKFPRRFHARRMCRLAFSLRNMPHCHLAPPFCLHRESHVCPAGYPRSLQEKA